MATQVKERRRHNRHRLSTEAKARVEFVYPQPYGGEWSFQLIDISISGFAFVFSDDFPQLDVGQNLPKATLTVGTCSMRGEMVVMHVNDERGVCGVLFYPASDIDLVKMKAMNAGIQAVSC